MTSRYTYIWHYNGSTHVFELLAGATQVQCVSLSRDHMGIHNVTICPAAALQRQMTTNKCYIAFTVHFHSLFSNQQMH
jgi:hypothetical protein